MSDLNCPRCGVKPTEAIDDALAGCQPGDAFEQLTKCDHCDGEIGIAVSKEAYVNRRGKGYSDAEMKARREEKEATALSERDAPNGESNG